MSEAAFILFSGLYVKTPYSVFFSKNTVIHALGGTKEEDCLL